MSQKKKNILCQETLKGMREQRKQEISNNVERANAIYALYESKGWQMSEELHQFLNGLHKL